jgi:hypothetical protein
MISQHAMKAATLGVFVGLALFPLNHTAEAAPSAKPGPATDTRPPVSPAISPEVGIAVLNMGKTISARDLTFTARTIRVYLDPSGQPLHIVHTVRAMVRRPDRLAVQITGDDGDNALIYDGKSAFVFAPERKAFSVIPVSGDIPSALGEVADKFNVDFPLIEFFADSPEKSLLRGVVAGWQVGTAEIDGVECRHLFFTAQGGTDIELWVENNDAAIPHRLIVTYRLLPGQPNFIAEFTNWDSQAHLSDADFAFQPPADAKRIDLAPAGAAGR